MAVDNTTKRIVKISILTLIISATVLFFFTVVGFKGETGQPSSETVKDPDISVVNVSFPDSVAGDVEAWVVDTPLGRSRGLSVVDSLDESQAMLFVFDTLGIYPFWMKDMKFPIDIIWLNADKEIVFIRESAQPEEYPDSYNPQTEALYVLEVVDGFTDKYNIALGQKLYW
jgi:uncharacterized membrane protein (UPF0127 family)